MSSGMQAIGLFAIQDYQKKTFHYSQILIISPFKIYTLCTTQFLWYWQPHAFQMYIFHNTQLQ